MRNALILAAGLATVASLGLLGWVAGGKAKERTLSRWVVRVAEATLRDVTA